MFHVQKLQLFYRLRYNCNYWNTILIPYNICKPLFLFEFVCFFFFVRSTIRFLEMVQWTIVPSYLKITEKETIVAENEIERRREWKRVISILCWTNKFEFFGGNEAEKYAKMDEDYERIQWIHFNSQFFFCSFFLFCLVSLRFAAWKHLAAWILLIQCLTSLHNFLCHFILRFFFFNFISSFVVVFFFFYLIRHFRLLLHPVFHGRMFDVHSYSVFQWKKKVVCNGRRGSSM